jgi:hypothetical protein
MKRSLIILVICTVALGVGVTKALAGEASGHNVVVIKPTETTELGEGLVYAKTANSQVCVTTDPSHPLNGASGDCSGACVRQGDADPACMGSCTWVDREGDLAFFTWTGENEGTWKIQGGTGKWANASGSGKWKSSAIYAGGMGANSWKGSIEME